MQGRKPTPTHLRALDGNAGRRPLRENTPDPVGDLLAAPDWMSDEQKKSWAYAIEHAPKGLLRKLDSSLLSVWVVAEDLHRQASMQVKRYGMIVKSTSRADAVAVQSPYLPIINRQAELMLRAAAELGFTPTSRSRITLGAGEKEANRFSKHATRRA